MGDKGGECIQVCVRCRPMNSKEKNEERGNIIEMDLEGSQVLIKNPTSERESEPKGFTFDAVYDEHTIQKNFYDESCFTLIESVLEGFNGTIFAYGQTGCGKSFTMQGPAGVPDLKGVIPHAISHVFEAIGGSKDVGWLVRCSYLEIYNEEIKDLLSTAKQPPKCDIKEDPDKGVFVKGLSDVVVENEADLNKLLDQGQASRTVAATAMNAESSRSHSIFTVIIEASSVGEDGREMFRAGKLNLVDLAGSERQKKTGATGALLREGAKINLSLTALGNVISALASGKGGHIPYRDSKLTRLLQDSLGGNTKTLMVAAISPADYNYDETLSTLRYANRAKNIKNIPKINEDPKDAMLREYKDEIEKLKAMLEAAASGGAVPTAAPVAAPAASSMNMDFAALAPGGDSNTGGADAERAAELDEALKAKESEIAEERRQREEMAQRLQDMMSKLQGQGAAKQDLGASGRLNLTGEIGAIETPSEDQLARAEMERAELERVHRERLAKVKKRQQKKARAEMEKMNQEKAAMADELAELRALLEAGETGTSGAAPTASDNQSQAEANGAPSPTRIDESKLRAVKKKYDKKVRGLMREIDELQEEAHFDRERLLEELRQQARDTRLYELICREVLTEKELRRVCDKARWDEDEEDWVVPYVKARGDGGGGGGGGGKMSMGQTSRSSGKPNFAATQKLGGGGNNGGVLPEIGGGGRGREGMGMVSSSLPQLSPADTTLQMGQTMNLTAMGFGGAANDAKKKKKNKSKEGGLPSVAGVSGASAGFGALPQLGGMQQHQQHHHQPNIHDIDEGIYDDQDYEDESGDGDYVSSAPSSSTVATAKTNATKYVPNAIDEAGTGENAGAISDWGFAMEDENQSKRSNYSNIGEDDIVSMNQVKERKRKKKKKQQQVLVDDDADEGPVRRSRAKPKNNHSNPDYGGGTSLPSLV